MITDPISQTHKPNLKWRFERVLYACRNPHLGRNQTPRN